MPQLIKISNFNNCIYIILCMLNFDNVFVIDDVILLHRWHDSGRGSSCILLPPETGNGLHLSVELNALEKEKEERGR